MKSEKEKMLDVELYNAADPELLNDRMNVRRLTRLFNHTIETDEAQRTEKMVGGIPARVIKEGSI
ncbi:maltose acetyltransferase domain-containing protein [Psychrobacillus sp. NPDC096426]|uniref:maltose acetyltransferase domain-containing protein n=1 Tax=Psychrobacillus sp. NPDC096426 TaxID=3364491 RepID=UPI0038028E65